MGRKNNILMKKKSVRKFLGWYSSEFLVEALKLLTPYFTPEIFICHTRFQTWPLKSIPVFRPEGQSMSNSNITLSFLFIWN